MVVLHKSIESADEVNLMIKKCTNSGNSERGGTIRISEKVNCVLFIFNTYNYALIKSFNVSHVKKTHHILPYSTYLIH